LQQSDRVTEAKPWQCPGIACGDHSGCADGEG